MDTSATLNVNVDTAFLALATLIEKARAEGGSRSGSEAAAAASPSDGRLQRAASRSESSLLSRNRVHPAHHVFLGVPQLPPGTWSAPTRVQRYPLADTRINVPVLAYLEALALRVLLNGQRSLGFRQLVVSTVRSHREANWDHFREIHRTNGDLCAFAEAFGDNALFKLFQEHVSTLYTQYLNRRRAQCLQFLSGALNVLLADLPAIQNRCARVSFFVLFVRFHLVSFRSSDVSWLRALLATH